MEEVIFSPVRNGTVFSKEQTFEKFECNALIQINSRLLKRLHEDKEDLGKVFSEFIDDALKPYAEYCSGAYVMATEMYLKNSSKFAAFRKKVELNPRMHGLPMDAMFIKPVQRLCRYPLLLEELRKNTPSSWEQYKSLTVCIAKIEKVMEQINEVKRQSEIVKRSAELEGSTISGLPPGFWSKQNRRLLSEETMNYSSMVPSKPFNFKKIRCWMFTDCMVLAKRKKMMVDFFCVAILYYNSITTTELPDEKEIVNGIEVVDALQKKTYVLLCPTPEIRTRWFEESSRLIENAKANTFVRTDGLPTLEGTPTRTKDEGIFKSAYNNVKKFTRTNSATPATSSSNNSNNSSANNAMVADDDDSFESLSEVSESLAPEVTKPGHRRGKSTQISSKIMGTLRQVKDRKTSATTTEDENSFSTDERKSGGFF